MSGTWSTVKATMQRGIDEGLVPGAVLAVGSAEEIRFVHGAGAMQVEPQVRPMAPDAIFDLASLTKVMAVASAVLLLMERGLLSLDQTLLSVDESISDLYSHWRGTPKASITLRHLLTHTSGLPAWHPLYVWGTGKEAVLDTIEQFNLHAAPGQRVEYSCLGFILLGHVVETVTGQRLDEFFVEHIAEPLGMNSTRYTPLKTLPASEQGRLVPTERGNVYEASKVKQAGQRFESWREGFYPGQVHDGNAWYAMEGVSGNAGLFGTAEDAVRFGQMWLRALAGSPTELLSPVVARLAVTDHTPGGSESRGLGWQLQRTPAARPVLWETTPGLQYADVSTAPLPSPRSCGELFGPRSAGHTGFTGTSLWFDPDANLVVALLTNRVHPEVKDGIMLYRARVHNAVAAAVSRGE